MLGDKLTAISRAIAQIGTGASGEVIFTSGTGTWTVPAGITSISLVVIGAGGNGIQFGGTVSGGGGGGLAYKNNIAVTPGQSISYGVSTPAGGGGPSTTSVTVGSLSVFADRGSAGSSSGSSPGGGAGNGDANFTGGSGASGFGGSVLGGSAATYTSNGANGGGQGIGLYGSGSTDNYGRGGTSVFSGSPTNGVNGAIRIIWGTGRSFPNNAQGLSYTTFNPSDKGAGVILTNNNLTVSLSNSPNDGGGVRSIIGKSSGKWYWEFTAGGVYALTAVMRSVDSVAVQTFPGQGPAGWAYYSNGVKINNGIQTNYGATYTTGDVIGVKLDMDAGTVEFLKNGVSQGVAFTGLSGIVYAATGNYTVNTNLGTANFGATPFVYPVPSGYNAGLFS